MSSGGAVHEESRNDAAANQGIHGYHHRGRSHPACPSENDAEIIKRLLENTVVRKIYLPKSVEYEEYLSSYEIFKCAEKYNIEIDVYDRGERVEICNGVYFLYSNSEGVNIFSESARFCFLNGKTNYVIGEKVHSFSEGELYEATLPLE